MNLTVLGSNSQGNSYVFQNDETALVIECGISLKQVKQALDFNVAKLELVIVSHIHGDHGGKIKDFEKAGLKVIYPGAGMAHKKVIQTKSWKVMPLAVVHDVETYCFLIENTETGRFLFLTDSHYCSYTFPGLNNILLETNYCQEILDRNVFSGKTNTALRARIIHSHMELQTAKEILMANDLRQVNNIVLLHLSDSNSDAARFKREVIEVTGKQVYIAEKGLTIPFNKSFV
jgi:phosphoribosyl 1,2-cyclic phosphodiesterase